MSGRQGSSRSWAGGNHRDGDARKSTATSEGTAPNADRWGNFGDTAGSRKGGSGWQQSRKGYSQPGRGSEARASGVSGAGWGHGGNRGCDARNVPQGQQAQQAHSDPSSSAPDPADNWEAVDTNTWADNTTVTNNQPRVEQSAGGWGCDSSQKSGQGTSIDEWGQWGTYAPSSEWGAPETGPTCTSSSKSAENWESVHGRNMAPKASKASDPQSYLPGKVTNHEGGWGCETSADSVSDGSGGWGQPASSPGWTSSDTGTSGWGDASSNNSGWGAESEVPRVISEPPPPPSLDSPWFAVQSAVVFTINWGQLDKNPLERLMENEENLRSESNVGYQMLMRMGWRTGKSNCPPSLLASWKDDRKGLATRTATSSPKDSKTVDGCLRPAPRPIGPLAQQLARDDPQGYQNLWDKYRANWKQTDRYG